MSSSVSKRHYKADTRPEIVANVSTWIARIPGSKEPDLINAELLKALYLMGKEPRFQKFGSFFFYVDIIYFNNALFFFYID